ncbi:Acyltransferase [Bacteroidales bacterium Barb6XT]|nr:Acyltransferase [Bacteroidales bacterium Barb6XT]
MTRKYIDIRQILQTKTPSIAGKIPGFLVNYLIRIVHQDEVNHILNKYHDKDGVAFMLALIDYFDLRLELEGEENIPDGGRFIFASNHPLGGMDGICLSAVLGKRFNGKVQCPVNDLLLFIPQLRSICIPVNKHGRQARETAVQTEETYASDSQIITFPAGLCSRKIKGKIIDLEWKKSFIQKAVNYRRDVVPVRFEGTNSRFFYTLANLRLALGIKTNLEMLYLADEFFRSRHSTYRISFGKPIPWQSFAGKNPAEQAARVKAAAYNLNVHQ